MESLLVVGGGLAGLSAARAARDLGFDGRLQVLGAEPCRAYDRPPLSKDYLAGRVTRADLGLEADGEDLGARWCTGTAVALEPGRGVRTGSGELLEADGVLLATGARARTLPGLPTADNLLLLRTVEDADRLRGWLAPGVRLVVVGAGLIGSEVAATASALGCSVTLLTHEAAPLAALYGAEVAPRLTALHARHGVGLHAGVSVASTEVEDGLVQAVVLTDGTRLPADVVLVAVGAAAETAWLEGSGLDLGDAATGDGVRCDRHGRALAGGQPVPGVAAAGDCAAWWDPHLQRHHRAQHWTDAAERPARAVAALLGVPAPARRPYLPYFWSDQYGHRVQMVGYASLADSVEVSGGDADDPAFLAVYRRGDEPVAALALDRTRELVRWRKTLVATLGQLPELPTEPSPATAPAAPAVAAPHPVLHPAPSNA